MSLVCRSPKRPACHLRQSQHNCTQNQTRTELCECLLASKETTIPRIPDSSKSAALFCGELSLRLAQRARGHVPAVIITANELKPL
eukprot:2630709-Amphidinium_carterae.2